MAFVIGTPSGSFGSLPKYGSMVPMSPCSTPQAMNRYMDALDQRESSSMRSSWTGSQLDARAPDASIMKRKSKMDALHMRTPQGQTLRLRLLQVNNTKHPRKFCKHRLRSNEIPRGSNLPQFHHCMYPERFGLSRLSWGHRQAATPCSCIRYRAGSCDRHSSCQSKSNIAKLREDKSFAFMLFCYEPLSQLQSTYQGGGRECRV